MATRHQCLGRLQTELALVTLSKQQACSMRKEPRRATFVGFNMRPGVADHRLVRLTQMSQCQTVRRRAIEHEKHFGIMIEQRANGIGRASGPVVKPVSRHAAGIGST